MLSQIPVTNGDSRFVHEALLYSGIDDFVVRVGAFVADSIEANEPILVAVSNLKRELLCEALGEVPDFVQFADMAELGRNPGRIIPAWRRFADENVARGTRFRGVGEPIWPERTADELIECVRHESLLNLAFEGSPAWWLICPYDIKLLSPTVVEEAFRTHPSVLDGDSRSTSASYQGLAAIDAPFDVPLAEPVGNVTTMIIDRLEQLEALRRMVDMHSTRFGVDRSRTADLTLAVNEVATNSLRYAGGPSTIRTWNSHTAIVFEVSDDGRIDDALIGRRIPSVDRESGFGLWLVHQLCDLVQVRTYETGTVVRLQMTRA